ncbi:MAG: dihydroorotase [Deltaproteobacteria bacterium]|nr:dihydroorotase [Candidatus Zymogenaceae bacterium]
MKMLIEGGTVIDPAAGFEGPADLVIENGKIAGIVKPGAGPKDSEIITAKGCIICPGLVDIHTHLREPGYEYKETIATGSRAAAAGGVTSMACMANTNPVNDNGSVTEFILKQARAYAVVRVYPIGAVTKGQQGEALAEIGDMREAGAVALSDDGSVVADSDLMRRGLEYAKTFGLCVVTHSEDMSLVGEGVMNEGFVSTELGLPAAPHEAEEIMIFRDVTLAALTGARVHIAHVTTSGGVQIIREAKKRGIAVTAETCPHYITLTDDAVRTFDTNTKVNPPLRTQDDVDAVIEGLADGTIDAVASDHAPHVNDDKEVEFIYAKSGMIGLETLLPLSLALVEQKKLSMSRLIRALTELPAGIISIDAGTLKTGAGADVTVFDPTEEWVYDVSKSLSKSRNTPFAGAAMRGRVKLTVVGGKVVYRDGTIV